MNIKRSQNVGIAQFRRFVIPPRSLNVGIELLPVWREIGMGFFLYEWRSHEYRKKNFLTNHEWLSRRDEIKIPHARRSRKWGIFILSQLLSHDVMSEEIYPSLYLSRLGVTFPFLRGKFQHRFLVYSIEISTMTK